MISRKMKSTFFFLAGSAMTANGFLYRHLRARTAVDLRAHLGPGQNNYMDGWVNVDANIISGKCDIWADLRNPLPFRDATLKACYSHHVIEHLPNISQHLGEVFRCLKPGGVYRVGGPNGDSAIAKFVQGDAGWFSDFPDKRKSLGGRLENFIFCRGEHLTLLTYSMLEEIMEGIGFSDLRVCKPALETHYPELFSDCLAKESESDFETPHTLIVEARRPTKG